MNSGTFFIRVWRLLSMLGFGFSLINSYISYPSEVAVRFNDIGQAVQYLDREVIFYSALGLFLFVYMITNTVVRLFPRIPVTQLPAPNHAVWVQHRDQFIIIYQNWFKALGAAVNTVLALGLMVLSFLNRSVRVTTDNQDFAWLLPMSTAIIAIVLISLPVRLLMKPNAEDE